jgi:hypothetical protein
MNSETAMPKLTLTLDRVVIERAKKLAKQRSLSVSAMFSQFIGRAAEESESSRRAARREKLPPITRKSRGLVKLPSDKSYRELIEEALAERYGL